MDRIIWGIKNNNSFAFFTALVFLLVLIALFAPYITSHDPIQANMQDAFQAPSAEHWFGTDRLGRDSFSRIIFGARNSLSGVLVLVFLVFAVGTTLGTVAGYFGGKIDTLIMRLSDIMISFPGIILAITIAGMLGGSLINSVIALVIVTWPKYARLSRSLVLKIREKDFVAAAVVNGGTPVHILWQHILPNILPLVIITSVTDIGALMIELAGLSFLGFGIQPPAPEWGAMINEGRQQLQSSPWLMIFPGLAIFITVVIFNLWGDSLRDVLDPREE